MAKIKKQMTKEHKEALLLDVIAGECKYSQTVIDRNIEEEVDDAVKTVLKKLFGEDKVCCKKTGNKNIDPFVPAYHGDKKCGKPDVMVYNFFDTEEISIIVEDKNFTSTENATQQAAHYATVGEQINKPVRVIIGNNPTKDLDVRVLVAGQYLPLIINGSEVHSFFGPLTLKLIYDNPNYNEFVLEEIEEKPFTQKDFHNIINKAKQYYRQIPEIGNNDDLSINFTVAFIALKMILDKQTELNTPIKNRDDKVFNTLMDLKTNSDIIDVVEKIAGPKANPELRCKYEDIFIIKDEKTEAETFNFRNTIDIIDVREIQDHKSAKYTSIISLLKKEFSEIPSGELSIDLFGEVYESLASKKTKAMLGEFFTRRHIIQCIVRMFLTQDDIADIVEHKYKIADPACGTGGFLTESFKYIKSYCEKEHPEMDISELASQIIVGYDINPNNVGRTRINMTLAGDGFSDIRRQNSLTSTNYAKGIKYVLTNVPYGTKGDYAIKDSNSSEEFIRNNNNKRLELNFVIKIIEMLERGGKAAIIVPEGLLEAPTLSGFRSYLLRHCKLNTIISLPKFAFAPYTKWKTYVIFIEKRTAPLKTVEDIKESERTWCYIVDNDGYANSDKRFPTKLINNDGSWKHDELSIYQDLNGVIQPSLLEKHYFLEAEDNIMVYKNEWNQPIYGKKFGFITMGDIKDKKTITYPVLSEKEVLSKIKCEATMQSVLSNESHAILTSLLSQTSKGYKVSKADYLVDGELKDEFVQIFEELQIEYNNDDKKYYDISKEVIDYSLPLIPEKYLRKKEFISYTLGELTDSVSKIEARLKELFGGINYEDK